MISDTYILIAYAEKHRTYFVLSIPERKLVEKIERDEFDKEYETNTTHVYTSQNTRNKLNQLVSSHSCFG